MAWPFMVNFGAQTSFFYIFRERELAYDLFESTTGTRMMHNYSYWRSEGVEGVGIIRGEEAISWGLSGPMVPMFGIEWNLHKVDHYECYDGFDWEVQWKKEGDSLARYSLQIGKMAKSIKIIQQALEGIPGGPFENLEICCFDRENNIK
ncbi:hypothetical protein CUMW_105950 [Citrus unshiu]|nr:hypothetical protein CUMW_105950 [Citrus unshiu]